MEIKVLMENMTYAQNLKAQHRFLFIIKECNTNDTF